MGEFTYDKVESNFSFWNLTRGSVSLHSDRLLLILAASKTDPFCQGVTLTISAATDEGCAVKSLYKLFEQFPKSQYHPLFSTSAGTFNRTYVTQKLQEGIRILGYRGNHTGHSFRRGAATSAKDYPTKKYNYLVDGSQIPTDYTSTPPPDWIHNASSRHQRTQPRSSQIPPPSVPSPPPPISTRTRSSRIPRRSRRW